jgi:NitT/TauT family transport system substrate-binding protein
MTPIRMILNTFYSGPQAWFFLAADRGYFADAGIEVTFTEGDTLANAVPRVASGAYDIGYGDLNALIELAGREPSIAPVAVAIYHNASPYTIAVAADGPIRSPLDLVGHMVLSHPNDAALRMFPEFARRTGLAPDRVAIEIDAAHHKLLLPRILSGNGAAGLFGFVNTLAAAALEADIDPAALRHFEWRQYVPELCGAAIIAGQSLVRDRPAAITGFVAAANRGLADTIADPDAAIDAVARRNPAIDRAANRARLLGTLALEMAHQDGSLLGIGDVNDARLRAAIKLIADVKALPQTPSLQQVFTRDFLPPTAERVRSLARLA